VGNSRYVESERYLCPLCFAWSYNRRWTEDHVDKEHGSLPEDYQFDEWGVMWVGRNYWFGPE
jgi:hypothetical protein